MATPSEKEAAGRVSAEAAFFFDTLERYRGLVLDRIRELIPQTGRFVPLLYGPMLDYPLREGKGFRPALCLSVAQACGGRMGHALDTAAALELFHNAFLIHDDIEDQSEARRGAPTLHAQHGIAAATNIGDALNMLALRTLLGNTAIIGLERSLVVVEDVSRMAKESTEGQAMELAWVANGAARPLTSRDYLTMIAKKTCWYTTIAPMRLGAILAGVPTHRLADFIPFGFRIGAAFQIQDDLLNLEGDEHLYGKESCGDIAEGKRTLMAIHALARAEGTDAARLQAIYATARTDKTADDVAFVLAQMEALGSIAYAREIARRLTASAAAAFDARFNWIAPGPHRRFIESMIGYMASRTF